MPEDGDENEELESSGEPGAVVELDDEEDGRAPFHSDSVDLVEAEARIAFADEIANDSHVDADPNAKDAAVAGELSSSEVAHKHLRGLLEALLFVTDRPIKAADLADVARAETKEVRAILEELSAEYKAQGRGFHLDELAGGWQFRTAATFAPFVREMTALKPVKLTRAQVETLAIVAYRQPVTRPEVDDVRGVDCGAVLKLLLDRDLIRVLGKKDEPGRPLLYGTTSYFLTFFGLKALRDLPTLREFTELSEESRDVVERELGDVLPEGPKEPASFGTSVVGDASLADVEHDPTDAKPEDEPKPAGESVENDDEERAEADQENDGLAEPPGGKSYDPSDEELFPDDDDSDFDDEDEDEDEEDEDEDDEEEEADEGEK